MNFVHLHNHSHFSILNGLPKPVDYASKSAEFGMPGVALTDYFNLHGGYEFYKACKGFSINPILGVEVNVTEFSATKKTKDNISHKIVLLAKNIEGYKNLISLVTYSNLEGFYYEPRIDLEILAKHSSNLIALSGTTAGDIPYQILSGKNDDEIFERIKFYQNIFGKENFYLELLYHDDVPKQNFITERLIEIHKKYGTPVVATNNCFYIEKEDKQTQDVIMCLNTGHTMDNPDRPTLINGDYSFLSPLEVERLFGHIPEAIENTLKINEEIHIKFDSGGILIPKYDLPKKDKEVYDEQLEKTKKEENIKELSSDEWYLRYICFRGLNNRYDYNIPHDIILELTKKLDKPGLQKKLQETSPEELKDLSKTYYTEKKKEILQTFSEDILEKIERLEYELVVVHEMGFDGYFLIVSDYINWARENDISVGPGRGSVAGALLAYLSGITDIDPLRYSLLFERFLNPARISMPDIDVDFSDDARDKVIDDCRKKYGQDHVVQICTFGTFAARAAVKDVGRVFGVNFQEMNKFASLIPEKPGTKLKGALEDSPEFKQAYDTNKKYKDIVDNALKIEGNVRQIGVHACAVIIAPEKMTNFTALQNPPKDNNTVITQYSAYPLEDLGLLKMDFLGLRNLTIISRALKIIERVRGISIDILNINQDDQKVFEVFCNGDTTGVFQFESDGMRKYLKDLKPNCFEDIIVMVSLYRPGPLQYIPTYIDRKQGREIVDYPHESLRKILSPTHGIAVYQEQIMQMVQAFAGFSLGEADILRRAIGKKKKDVLLEQKEKFVKASAEQGHSKELANHIFEDIIEPFAGYGFNKSHAACYAFIAYQTAFLKAYYPCEFLTSVMTSDEESMDRIVLEVGEALSKGINVLPPSVNESLKHFTYIDDKNIRFGLKAIKGVGEGPIDKLIQERQQNGKFLDLQDFIKRAGKEVINKRVLEALIKAGAMDDFGDRGQMFAGIQEMIRFLKGEDKKEQSSQIGLFDFSASEEFDESFALPEAKSFTYCETLEGEQEVVGFWISGHPLDGLKKYIKSQTKNGVLLTKTFDELEGFEEEKKKAKFGDKKYLVQTAGFITDIRTILTKNGKNMLFAKFENYYGDFEITVFDRDFSKLKDVIVPGKFIILEGEFSANTEYRRKTILVNNIGKVQVLNLDFIRKQAKMKKLFDDTKFNKFIQQESTKKVEVLEPKVIDESEESIEETENYENIEIEEREIEISNEKQKEFIVFVPNYAKKNDLNDFKEFLEGLKKGETEIFIDIKGNKITTKISVEDYKMVEKWALNKWS